MANFPLTTGHFHDVPLFQNAPVHALRNVLTITQGNQHHSASIARVTIFYQHSGVGASHDDLLIAPWEWVSATEGKEYAFRHTGEKDKLSTTLQRRTTQN